MKKTIKGFKIKEVPSFSQTHTNTNKKAWFKQANFAISAILVLSVIFSRFPSLNISEAAPGSGSSITYTATPLNSHGGTATGSDFSLSVLDGSSVERGPIIGNGASLPVTPGTYTLAENLPSGYGTTGVFCTSDISGSLAGAVSSLTVGADENFTCFSIDNDKQGILNVVVNVDNTGNSGTILSPSDVTVAVNGSTAISSFPGSGTGTSNNVNAGSYTVTPTFSAANFNTTFSGDCNSSGVVNVGTGASETCNVNVFAPPATKVYVTYDKYDAGDGTVSAVGSDSSNVFCDFVQCRPLDPAHPTAPFTQNYLTGTTITVTATPDASSTFDYWSGLCSGTDPVCNTTVTGTTEITAHFSVKGTKGNLTVKKVVAGSDEPASDFTLYVANDVFMASTTGSTEGTVFSLDPSDYKVFEFPVPSNFTQTFSGDCDADGDVTISADDSKTCIVTNTFVEPVSPPFCSLASGTDTQTAGFTETNPQLDPLNPNGYDGAGTWSQAAVANTVIPPWIDPSAQPNFTGSGALWVSATAAHPGQAGGQGNPAADQWRLFRMQFNASTTDSVTLYYSADNAASVYLNGALISDTPQVSTFDAAVANPPHVFENVYSVTLAPAIGTNTISFVVRNEGGDYDENPTGLVYKLQYNNEDNTNCLPITVPTPSVSPTPTCETECGGGEPTPTPTPCDTACPFSLTKSGEGNGTITIQVDGATTTTACDIDQCNPDLSEQSAFTGTYASGTVITLTAQPDDNSSFTGTWTSAPGVCTGDEPVCTFTITAGTTVNAHFSVLDNGSGPVSTTSGGGPGGGGPVGLSFLSGGGPGPASSPGDGSVAGAFTDIPSAPTPTPAVLGASTTLPRTGLPVGFILLAMLAGAAAFVFKKSPKLS